VKVIDNTFSFQSTEDSPGVLLWQLTSLWQRELKRILDRFGLTHSQFVLLASTQWLCSQGQDVTQVVLASCTRIDPMTTSTVLKTLQQRKLITRQEHATDTRAKSVVLTDEGKRLTRQAVKAAEKFDADFFSPLGEKTVEFNRKLLLLMKSWE
jgi:MarR family transcriptional regulator, organic hydroperoxide resistance regulator